MIEGEMFTNIFSFWHDVCNGICINVVGKTNTYLHDDLTFHHEMAILKASTEKYVLKILWEKKKMLTSAFSPFPQWILLYTSQT